MIEPPELPHSVEAEEYILSSCFLDGGQSVKLCIDNKLTAAAFFRQPNRIVYDKLLELHARGAPVSLDFVAEELRESQQLDQIGGVNYLTQISKDTPTTLYVVSYISKVLSLYNRRKLIRIGQDIAFSANEPGRDIEVLIERAQNLLGGVEVTGKYSTLWDRVLATRILPEVEPPEPEKVFSIGGKPVGRGGNLVVLASLPGEGKSTMIQAALAAMMASPDDCIDALGWSSENSDEGLVLHLDTEQEAHDHWNLIRRAMRRANIQKLPAWLHSYNVLGFKRRERLEFLREWMVRHRGQRIKAILIDGGADLVLDVNDLLESFSVVDELHAMVTTTGACMIVVIHLNPGQNSKTRGHFGSEMQRKAHSQIELRRDGDEIVVHHKKGRHGVFQDYRFAWSDARQMHESLGRYINPELIEWRDGAFGSDVTIGANEAIRRIEAIKGKNCSNGTARSRWRKIVASALVTKTAEGSYRKCG